MNTTIQPIDLDGLRELFNRSRIMLCFNGPISRSLIEEIGNALRNYLEADNAHPSSAMDVFAVYIEMTQNIRHYANLRGYGEALGAATVVVARSPDGRYIVQAGNLVEHADGEVLMERVRELAALDKEALKALYKAQRRRPRQAETATGAGLGLVDMARKSGEPLAASISPGADGRSLFCVRAVI